jgi:hypothetical protein
MTKFRMFSQDLSQKAKQIFSGKHCLGCFNCDLISHFSLIFFLKTHKNINQSKKVWLLLSYIASQSHSVLSDGKTMKTLLKMLKNNLLKLKIKQI